ncbi:MAG: hypothetical protein ACYDBQ_07305 [Thermoplasmatota archaeon]
MRLWWFMAGCLVLALPSPVAAQCPPAALQGYSFRDGNATAPFVGDLALQPGDRVGVTFDVEGCGEIPLTLVAYEVTPTGLVPASSEGGTFGAPSQLAVTIPSCSYEVAFVAAPRAPAQPRPLVDAATGGAPCPACPSIASTPGADLRFSAPKGATAVVVRDVQTGKSVTLPANATGYRPPPGTYVVVAESGAGESSGCPAVARFPSATPAAPLVALGGIGAWLARRRQA